MVHLLVDLDGTLVLTQNDTRPFFKTAEGRRYITDNIGCFDTAIPNQGLMGILEKYIREENLTVVTNSPVDYGVALLGKHEFDGVTIYGSMGKPQADNLLRVLVERKVNPREAVIVGDSPVDIYLAHALEITSIGIDWDGTKEQALRKSQPTFLARTIDEFAEALELIEECGCEYTPLKTPYRRFNPDELALVSDPEIEIFSAGNYIPFNRRNPNEPVNTFSSEIITLKRAKEYTYEELTQHRRDQPEFTDDYFAGGLVRTGKSFSDVFRRMFEMLLPIFEGANTNEMHLIIPAPNSNPEECYASDVNYIFTNAISRYFEDMYSFDKRFLVRADPVRKSGRSTDEHIRTIGTTDGIQYRDFRHAVIFDDVTTSGSQIAAIGKVLRASGYEGNLSGVVLGKTV